LDIGAEGVPEGRSGILETEITLQELDQATSDGNAGIYSGSNSTLKIHQVLTQTRKLLDNLIVGSSSVEEIQEDVNVGLGVFANIAKHTPRKEDEVTIGPTVLVAIESTLIQLGQKVLEESADRNLSAVEYKLSNGIVGVRQGNDSDIFFSANLSGVVTHILVPKEWSSSFQADPPIYLATLVPGNAFRGQVYSGHPAGKDKEMMLNSDVISFTFSNADGSESKSLDFWGKAHFYCRNKFTAKEFCYSCTGNPIRIVFEHKEGPEAECNLARSSPTASQTNFQPEKKTHFVKGSGICVYLNTTNS